MASRICSEATIVVVLAVLLFGCGPDQRYKNDIRVFAVNSSVLKREFDAALVDVQKADLKASGDLKDISGIDAEKASKLDMEAFGPRFFKDSELLRARKTAVAVIATYGRLLGTFATGESAEEVSRASEDLGAALESLDARYSLKIGSDKIGLLTGVVGFVGRIIVAKKERKAVALIANYAHQPLHTLGKNLKADAGDVKDVVKKFYDDIFQKEVAPKLVKVKSDYDAAVSKNNASEMLKLRGQWRVLIQRGEALRTERDALLAKVDAFNSVMDKVLWAHDALRSRLTAKDGLAAVEDLDAEFRRSFRLDREDKAATGTGE